MGGHRPDYPCPADLDVRDPNFPGRYLLWARQQQFDVADLIEGTKETLAASRALIREADRLLGLR